MFQTTSQMKHGNRSPTNIWGKLVVSPWKIVKQLVIPFKHGDSRMRHTRWHNLTASNYHSTINDWDFTSKKSWTKLFVYLKNWCFIVAIHHALSIIYHLYQLLSTELFQDIQMFHMFIIYHLYPLIYHHVDSIDGLFQPLWPYEMANESSTGACVTARRKGSKAWPQSAEDDNWSKAYHTDKHTIM